MLDTYHLYPTLSFQRQKAPITINRLNTWRHTRFTPETQPAPKCSKCGDDVSEGWLRVRVWVRVRVGADTRGVGVGASVDAGVGVGGCRHAGCGAHPGPRAEKSPFFRHFLRQCVVKNLFVCFELRLFLSPSYFTWSEAWNFSLSAGVHCQAIRKTKNPPFRTLFPHIAAKSGGKRGISLRDPWTFGNVIRSKLRQRGLPGLAPGPGGWGFRPRLGSGSG